MPAAALELPADERVVRALARLGMATVDSIGTREMRAALREPVADAEGLAGELDKLAGLLASGRG